MTTHLDGAELFHLALDASTRQEHGAAIAYLKQALALSNGSAMASNEYGKFLYMLGAEYAQISMFDRAQEHLAQAIDMNPELHTACLQLGLLHMTQGEVAQALSSLAPLDKLPEHNCLHHLGAGLRHLLHNEVALCRHALQQGMALNIASSQPNMALNQDMTRLLSNLPEGDVQPDQVHQAGTPNTELDFLMSAYNRDKQRMN